jgi:RimJ/RimL family protein N-acetyltransferase
VAQDDKGQGAGTQQVEHPVTIGRRGRNGPGDRGCRRVEAVTIPENAVSLAFHERMGFTATGHGVSPFQAPVVADHAGPGQHRVVLEREL